MRLLNPCDIDTLVSIQGLVIRNSDIIPDLQNGYFSCQICSSNQNISLSNGIIETPSTCMNVGCGAKGMMKLNPNRSEFANKQLTKLQEMPNSVPLGQTPHTIVCALYDDLVDKLGTGERVDITAIYRTVPVKEQNGRGKALKSVFRTFLDVVNYKCVHKSVSMQQDRYFTLMI